MDGGGGGREREEKAFAGRAVREEKGTRGTVLCRRHHSRRRQRLPTRTAVCVNVRRVCERATDCRRRRFFTRPRAQMLAATAGYRCRRHRRCRPPLRAPIRVTLGRRYACGHPPRPAFVDGPPVDFVRTVRADLTPFAVMVVYNSHDDKSVLETIPFLLCSALDPFVHVIVFSKKSHFRGASEYRLKPNAVNVVVRRHTIYGPSPCHSARSHAADQVIQFFF